MPMIAALPMYDWPEARSEVDAQWDRLRDRLRQTHINAPDALTRDGDLQAIWRHPHLIFAQTCWGPLEQGLGDHVLVVGQPDYSAFEGGDGPLYSSAILMRKGAGSVAAPVLKPHLPLELLRGRRFIYNSDDSMSGVIALSRDMAEEGVELAIFSERSISGGHRLSARAVAAGEADVCACDCRSWAMLQRFEPDTAARLDVVGWTGKRKGLPYIMARALGQHERAVRAAIQSSGL